jgi:hypothetical protein
MLLKWVIYRCFFVEKFYASRFNIAGVRLNVQYRILKNEVFLMELQVLFWKWFVLISS